MIQRSCSVQVMSEGGYGPTLTALFEALVAVPTAPYRVRGIATGTTCTTCSRQKTLNPQAYPQVFLILGGGLSATKPVLCWLTAITASLP